MEQVQETMRQMTAELARQQAARDADNAGMLARLTERQTENAQLQQQVLELQARIATPAAAATSAAPKDWLTPG